MATVKAFIRSSSKKKYEINVAVRFRLCDGRKKQLFHKSEIIVDPDLWDEKKECIKSKVLYNRLKRAIFDKSIVDRKILLNEVYESAENKEELTSEEFERLIDMKLHPENYNIKTTDDRLDFFHQFDVFLDIKNYPQSDLKNYQTMIRMLKRFEMYMSVNTGGQFKWDFQNITVDTIRELERFVRDEHSIINKKSYKFIYKEIPEKRAPGVRGANTIAKIMKRFRTFIKWCMKEKLLENDPYVGYEQKSPIYGTPYYISIEERTIIAETDLHDAWERLPKEKKEEITKSSISQLEIQRDIFVFHCMIGCRVGDLVKFTPTNIINGHVSYIARKTTKERVDAIEVPLNTTAKAILEKYWDGERTTGPLLPFISPQKYNDCIKAIFLLCGITRNVTVWNSTTGQEEQHPINEIASSHLARRTFIGNLYKKVQDPNMIGKLSGHVEGSRAFARYRAIDEEMKQNMVNMLE